MPTSLSNYLNCSSKSLRLIFLLILLPTFIYSQTLTGLWTGTLSNDSTTVRKDQSFEIALTEYKGKVYGYSRSEFIVDQVLYYVVKRVKGTIEGDECKVVDDEIIAFNFPTKLDKGIKVTSIFKRNKNDSVWQLDGSWKTNATKKYYAVTGKVGLEEEKDLTASKIFPHLEELKLANTIAFYKEREEGIPIVKIAKPEKIISHYLNLEAQEMQHTGTMAAIKKPVIVEAKTVLGKEEIPQIATNKIDLSKTSLVHNTIAKPTITQTEKQIFTIKKIKEEPNIVKQTYNKAEQEKVTAKATVKINTEPAITKNITPTKKQLDVNYNEKKEVATSKPIVIEKQKDKSISSAAPLPRLEKKPIEEIIKSAGAISGRKSEFSQEVNFRSDSLVLSLYDNGEIDGDTVSLFMNGEIIMAKQGLKASAIKKTIYISSDSEDFTLVLFADNLGKYPPNTGLLVVHDGEDVYNLRFSSDFQKNAGIVFRRKKN